MSCTTTRIGILSEEMLNDLISSHDADFIYGLDYSKQRQAVNVIAENLYNSALSGKRIGSGTAKDSLLAVIDSNIEEITQSIENLEKLNTEGNFDNAISLLKENLKDNQVTKENIDKLIRISRDVLSKLDGVTIRLNDKYINDTEDITNEVTSAGIERTSFSDTFSLELNSRDTISGDIKKYLGFIRDSQFANRELVPKQSYLNTPLYLNFSYVYKELHRLLEGVEANRKEVFDRLQEYSNKALAENNQNLSWVPGFLERLKDPKQTPEHILREFVMDMSKDKIDMFHIQHEDVEGDSQLRVFNDNSAAYYRKLLSNWKRQHTNSKIVDNGKYSEEVYNQLREEIGNIRQEPDKGKQAKMVTNWLQSLGINVNEAFLDSIFLTGNKFRYPTNKTATASDFSNKGGLLHTILNNITPGQEVSESNFTNDNIVQGLAIGSSKFERDEFDNSFRVADKLIYIYTLKQYINKRTKELKSEDGKLVEQLKKVQFAKDSLYLQLLENDPDFKNWFDTALVSLNPLKIKKGRRSEDATTISPLDMEVVKIGMFNSQRGFDDMTFNNTTYKIRNAKYFYPTFSDKSRIMLGNGIAVDGVFEVVTKTITTEDGKQITRKYNDFTPQAINLYYESVIQPELNRIYNTHQETFKSNVNLDSYEGGLFYLNPYLNDIEIDYSKDTGKKRLLLDVVKDNPKLDNIARQQVENAIKSYLRQVAQDKINIWKELGILQIDENTGGITTNYVELIKDSNDKTKGIQETAFEFVYNNLLFNANSFQLIHGDPAQYFKGDIQAATLESITSTYDNITKRLAAEIAPGNEMEGPDYIQLYAKDLKKESVLFERLLVILDGITLKDYENLTDEKKEQLKAYPYSFVNSTDAQEYTTWREHLNIMFYKGELTLDEYDEVEEAFSKGKNPSKSTFKKVLQPMKPVYADNNPYYQVGEMFLDKKTYIKSSSFPLIPTLTQGLELDKLRVAIEKLEDQEDMGVRVAYKTAVKVGFPANALSIYDEQGNVIVPKLSITDGEVLSRKGLRIQQDIPYDEKKDKILAGSQEKKLKWANILSLKGFRFKGKNYTGEELRTIHDNTYLKLYLHGLDKLHKRILDTEGKELDMSMLSSMLKNELVLRGETTKPLLDGLGIVEIDGKKEFKTPLWISPYADKYMSLLSSIVKNNVVSHKLTGKSFVLGSNAGLKTFTSVEEAVTSGTLQKSGIVFTDSYNPELGLQPQHIDSEGVVQPAQIMIPFKFRDSNGNILNLKSFTRKDKSGKTIIDHDKLPKELLKSFGFRIPTQLHASMSYMEIVGFLPSVNGDLIIAPAEFTTQMGSDFDVDKLYTYITHATFDENSKTFKKTEPLEGYKNSVEELNKTIKKNRRNLRSYTDKPSEVYSYILNKINDYKSLNTVPNIEGVTKAVLDIYPQIESSVISNIVKSLLRIEKLDKQYIGGIHNTLLDINLSIVSNKEVQKMVLSPLSSGSYPQLAQAIEFAQANKKRYKSIIDESYQTEKFYDGTSGKAGIAIFSSNSVFNALAQGKDLQIVEDFVNKNGELDFRPISIKFGNKYNESTGNLSQEYSLRKGNPKLKTEVIAASQNISVDNANEQLMFKVNMNGFTFPAYSILEMLGYEEDINTTFMSQPILVDYVKQMRNRNSILQPFVKDREELIVKELKDKYLNDKLYSDIKESENILYLRKLRKAFPSLYKMITAKLRQLGYTKEQESKDKDTELHDYKKLQEKYIKYSTFQSKDVYLADFNGQDAFQEMYRMLQEGKNYPNFNKIQVAVLDKFLRLKDYHSNISRIQGLLNLDSKGFDKNMYLNMNKRDITLGLNNLAETRILNAEKLIGEYEVLDGIPVINPTTLAGYDNILGLNTLINNFGEFFLEADPNLKFRQVLDKLAFIISDNNSLPNRTVYKIREEYKSWLLTNFRSKNIYKLRKDLFTNDKEGSLFQNIKKLKATSYWQNNSFLKNLDVNIVDDTLVVDYNNVNSDVFDDTNTYLSFIDLFRNNREINGVNPSILGEQLIQYSLLRGNKIAQQFIKFVPPIVLEEFIDIPKVVMDTDVFVDQWIRHNAEEAPRTERYEKVKGRDSIIPKEDTDFTKGKYISTKDKYNNIKLYKYVEGSENEFTLINQLGSNEFTEYAVENTQQSILKKNNVVEEIISESEGQEIVTGRNTPVATVLDVEKKSLGDSIKNTINTIIDKLNFESVDNLINSIAALEEYNEFSTLAKAVKDKVSKDLTLEVDPNGYTVSYNNTTKTIKLGLKELQSYKNERILSAIMHEIMHSLTSDNINSYIEGAPLPSTVQGALEDLEYYKNTIISELTEDQNEVFRNVIVGYALQTSEQKRESIIMDPTVHNRVKDWIVKVNDYLEDKLVGDDTLTMIEQAKEAKYNKNITVAYYSLLDLKEFIAVSSTDNVTRQFLDTILPITYWEKVKELFKAILDALGLTSKDSRALVDKILQVAEINTVVENEGNVENIEQTLDDLYNSLDEEGDRLRRRCKGERKAEKGMRNGLTAGGEWSLLKDLKGLPSHAKGGVDLQVGNGTASFATTNGRIEAKYGLFISGKPVEEVPKSRELKPIKNSDWKEVEMVDDYLIYAENGLYFPKEFGEAKFDRGNIWKVITDLEGFPSHNQGGIDIFVSENNNVGFSNKGSKIEAKCGCVIPATLNKDTVNQETQVRKKKRKRYEKSKLTK